MSRPIYLNGIDGTTGQAPDDFQLTTDLIAKVARQKPLSKADLHAIRNRHNQDLLNKTHMGVAEGIDIDDLAATGWGVIFPAALRAEQMAALKDALKPLLDLRREQASKKNPAFYREFMGPELGYQPGETKNDFLKRLGRVSGAANPASGVPFYLLIVGSPEEIPFAFQYLLDVQYGVGRIHFDTLEDYALYAQSVVRAEKGEIVRNKRAVFWGTSHDNSTRLSSTTLINPLANQVTAHHPDWDVRSNAPEQATKAELCNLLGGAETPALLFTASHGMRFRLNDQRLLPHTGALLCQDYINHTGGKIPEDYYFSAQDIPADADVAGTLGFFFACFGAGSPRLDNFYRMAFEEERPIAPYAFLSRLPVRMLTHPRGGALGVFAHIERAWSYSFQSDDENPVSDVETFRSMLSSLINGKPAGAASDFFGSRYGEVSTELTEELDTPSSDHQDEDKIARLWTFNNDARNYVFVGDPAVRLAV